MYCRQCGNKVLDSDKFCSKCGAEIVADTDSLVSEENNSSPTSDYNSENHSATKNFMDNSVVKFFVYGFIFVVLEIMVCAVALPPRVSLFKFITTPEGFGQMLGRCIGSGLSVWIFVVPLMYGLKKIGVTDKTYKMETFFILAFLCQFFFSR